MNFVRIELTSRIATALLLAVFCVGCMPMPPLQKAVSHGSMPEVDILLAQGADINSDNPLHGTALTVAARNQDMPMIMHLLDKGADVNSGSPLSIAAWNGNETLARLLIAKGADVNKSGNSGLPLYLAAEQNNSGMVSLLLAAGAHPDGNGDGSPLHIASYRGYDDIVRKLLEARANPNLNGSLSAAVRFSPSLLTSRLLLEHGADVNASDERGMTALHDAAIAGRIAQVQLLLRHGAKPEMADHSGKLALDYARENNYPDIVNVLTQSKSR